MYPKQPYVEVPYVPEEAPEVRTKRVVWYKRPMMVPLLMVVVLAGAIYFAYQMYRGTHPDDGYSQTATPSDGSESAKSTPPAIGSTSGSGIVPDSQTAKPDASDMATVEAASGSATPSPATDAPATDSLPAQPPNGKAYAGSGRLELYRQGNITYQYNTETGDSCVMYASLREWRNPIVYRHSCR